MLFRVQIVAALLAAVTAFGCRRGDAPPPGPQQGTAAAQQKAVASSRAAEVTQEAKANAATEPAADEPNVPMAALVQWLGQLRQQGPQLAAAWEQASWAAMDELWHSGDAYIRAGDRALARGDYDTAVRCFEQAFALNKSSADARKGLAIALTACERHEAAAALYEQILAAEPNDVVSLYNLGVALSRTGKLGLAQEKFAQVLRLQDDHLEARCNWATIAQVEGKLAEARRLWTEVCIRWPRLGYAHAKLGEVLMDLGDANAAATAFSEAAKLDVNNADNWLNYASASWGAGRLGEAMVALKRAGELAPQEPLVWSWSGDIRNSIYEATGKIEFLQGALADWRKSLALDGQDDLRIKIAMGQKTLADAQARLAASQPAEPKH